MKQVISVRLEQSTIDKLKAQAKKEHRSLSNLIGMMIEQVLIADTMNKPAFGQYTHIDVLLRDKAVKE